MLVIQVLHMLSYHQTYGTKEMLYSILDYSPMNYNLFISSALSVQYSMMLILCIVYLKSHCTFKLKFLILNNLSLRYCFHFHNHYSTVYCNLMFVHCTNGLLPHEGNLHQLLILMVMVKIQSVKIYTCCSRTLQQFYNVWLLKTNSHTFSWSNLLWMICCCITSWEEIRKFFS